MTKIFQTVKDALKSQLLPCNQNCEVGPLNTPLHLLLFILGPQHACNDQRHKRHGTHFSKDAVTYSLADTKTSFDSMATTMALFLLKCIVLSILLKRHFVDSLMKGFWLICNFIKLHPIHVWRMGSKFLFPSTITHVDRKPNFDFRSKKMALCLFIWASIYFGKAPPRRFTNKSAPLYVEFHQKFFF